MAVYDLEEQEKLDDLKAWWATYGKYVSAAVVTVAVVVIGVQGWRWYQHTQALKALDVKTDEAFAPLYADLRGDILASAGKNADARSAYQTALAKLDAKSGYRAFIQAKLDALGGPLPPPADAAAAPAAPPPSA